MEISFYGANCLKLQTKEATTVVDDNLVALGLKNITSENDVAMFTQERFIPKGGAPGRLSLTTAGEYELGDVTIIGIAAKAHTDLDNEKSAVMYRLVHQNWQIVVLGHCTANLSDKELEALGVVDVLIVPVGGGGYTLDAEEAVSLVKRIEPKMVIPTHFADDGISYEVPQAPLGDFLTKMGAQEPQKLKTLKLKGDPKDAATGIFVLER